MGSTTGHKIDYNEGGGGEGKYFGYYSVRQDAQLTKKNSVVCT